ncbi:hypothetical protein [uncultured Clostridium sp.]|uniref:hypothetical protein n=1 Tax=uncultured Clostridium sp. TaxID=59620 RepID=UPI00263399E0|nr:hypothetical protein [uncultured Clostridium sp.]
MAKARTRTISSRSGQGTQAMYIPSSDIKIYPSSKRSDYYDRNARLSSEHNLVNVVNRLTSIQAFIIEGLNIELGEDDKRYIRPGSCNIHGYYFNILNSIDLSIFNSEYNNYLYFGITLKTTTVNGADGKALMFYNELVASDFNFINSNNDIKIISNSEADISALLDGIDKDEFNGLEIIASSQLLPDFISASSEEANSNLTHYFLLIGQKDSEGN